MGFKKYEVLVRKISPVDIDNVIEMFKERINEKQKNDPVQLWAAHVMDLRTLREYFIFSDKSVKAFDIHEGYETKKKTIVPGVMYLGQKIKDVNEAIKTGLTKNEDTIKEMFSNFKINEKQLPENLLNNFKDLQSSIEEFTNIKETLTTKISTIENTLTNKIKAFNDIINTVDKDVSDLKSKVTNTTNLDPEAIKNINKEVKQQMETLNNLNNEINKIKEKVDNISITSNTVDDGEAEDLLNKITNDQNLSEEDKKELKEILKTTQGYVL